MDLDVEGWVAKEKTIRDPEVPVYCPVGHGQSEVPASGIAREDDLVGVVASLATVYDEIMVDLPAVIKCSGEWVLRGKPVVHQKYRASRLLGPPYGVSISRGVEDESVRCYMRE